MRRGICCKCTEEVLGFYGSQATQEPFIERQKQLINIFWLKAALRPVLSIEEVLVRV